MSEEDLGNGGVSSKKPDGITRRTIVKGAAWSLPVVAVAVAAPRASASVDDCSDVPINVTAVSHAWSDGNGGKDAIGSVNGTHVFKGGQSLFTDFTMQNTGQAVVTGYQYAWTVETNTVDTSSVQVRIRRPDGTWGPLVTPDLVGTDPAATDRTRWIWSFPGIPTSPGSSVVFRVTYKTIASTGGANRLARPYGIGQPRSIDCNGNDVLRTIADEQNPSDNNMYTELPYIVRQ